MFVAAEGHRESEERSLMLWFKMYAEFATDPKVQSMSEAMQRRLAMLFCLQCSGDLDKLDEDELALAMRINAKELEKTHAVFRKKGFVAEGWSLKNWRKRQAPSDPTARERMARMRARQAEDGVTLRRNVTGGVTGVTDSLRVETEGEGEGEGESVCVSRAREGSDLKDWEEALASLQTSGDAKAIAKQLRDWADHPEIAPVEAWKFIHAAHVINEKPDKATWAFFMGVVRRASRREFDAWHNPPQHDPAFPAPRIAPTRSAPALTDEKRAEIDRKLKERREQHAARCG